MGVQIRWLDDQRNTIHFIFEASWAWQEFFVANDEAGQWAAAQPHMVDALFDFRLSPGLPKNALTNFVGAGKCTAHLPNQGVTVVLIKSEVLKRVAQVAARFMPDYRVRFVYSLESAYAVLAEIRAKRVEEILG